MRESAFWTSARRGLLAALRSRALPYRVERVENLVGEGMPDVSMTVDGADVWVELKVRRRGRVKFEPQQPSWHERHRGAGGAVFVLVREARGVSLGHIDGERYVAAARFAAPVDWGAVLDVLLGGVGDS